MNAWVADNARSCNRIDGTPKQAYATEEAAMLAVHYMLRRTGDRLHPYRCSEHGYHLGHAVSHAPP